VGSLSYVVIDMQQKATEQKRGQCSNTQALEKTTIKGIGWEKGKRQKWQCMCRFQRIDGESGG